MAVEYWYLGKNGLNIAKKTPEPLGGYHVSS
jgi:hypothetical protein